MLLEYILQQIKDGYLEDRSKDEDTLITEKYSFLIQKHPGTTVVQLDKKGNLKFVLPPKKNKLKRYNQTANILV